MYKLVIQAPDIATQNLKLLAHLVNAQSIEAVRAGALRHQAFALKPADPAKRSKVAAFCDEARYDYAYVPEGARLDDIGLVVMDMDSTLITIECIDEIADLMGVRSQVSNITARAMRGELDFAQSLRERVALLEGLDEHTLEWVYSRRLALATGAEAMLGAFHAIGAYTLLVSGGFTYFTDRLQHRLSLTRTIANRLEVADGKLTGRLVGNIVDTGAKAEALVQMRDELGLVPSQVIALGDGANDLAMLAAAGYGIACHAKPMVKAQARYALDYVGLDGVLAYFD